MREGAAAAVLAGEADMRALGAEGTNRQCLGGAPVDPLAGFDRLPLSVEQAGDLAVQVKALRHACQPEPDLPQPLQRDRGVAAALTVRRSPQPGPAAFEPVGLVRPIALGGGELG